MTTIDHDRFVVWDERTEEFRQATLPGVFDPVRGEVTAGVVLREDTEEAHVEVLTAETWRPEATAPTHAAFEDTSDVAWSEDEDGWVHEEDTLVDVGDEQDADDVYALEDDFFTDEHGVVEPPSTRALVVRTEGRQERERKLRRFLDFRLAQSLFDSEDFARLERMLWGSGNWSATWAALERAMACGLGVVDLEWALEVRLECGDALDHQPCWKWLFDLRERLDTRLTVEETVSLLEMAHDAFVDDCPRMHRWYHFELEVVDREESHGVFPYYLEALLEQLDPTCDPLHALEMLLMLEREDQHTVLEHHRRTDHCALDTSATYFDRHF
jgi:hypothetical protein